MEIIKGYVLYYLIWKDVRLSFKIL